MRALTAEAKAQDGSASRLAARGPFLFALFVSKKKGVFSCLENQATGARLHGGRHRIMLLYTPTFQFPPPNFSRVFHFSACIVPVVFLQSNLCIIRA